jgi:2,3-bisphosphoglycerate-dependent phosphoglycerate mutase
MTTLYLVRHAHADWTPDEARPLSAEGRADAERLASPLADQPIVAIYSSPSRRAVQTVEPLAGRLGLEPILVSDLRERELLAPSAAAFESAVESTWRDPDRPYRGGEPNSAARIRGVAVVRRVLEQHADRHVVLSTHGSLLAIVLHAFDDSYGYEFWRSMTFPDAYALTFRQEALIGVRRVWMPESRAGQGAGRGR